jgi:hypothetical protein
MRDKYGEVSWERMIGAVEKVRDRLLRASAALEKAGVPCAVAGGNAVAAWVSRIGVGLVDATWPQRFLPKLAARLQELLYNPEG